ncbi:MAG: hypothetical protein KC776_02270 [Myxococcales bacterium]|nr:hypothetical protein [Myxococcales bacterium]MCB9582412.1 hypothetical protein [Polyangiaceae bacterium]
MVESEHPYETVTELASGDFGTLSVGQGAGRVVFLRRFPGKPPWNAAQLDAAAAASRRAKPIHHPNLLAVVDVHRTPGSLVVTTEYVEGVPLSVLMKRAEQKHFRIPVPAALRVAEELSRAFIAADELCLEQPEPWLVAGVHPECVLVSSGDDALIANLGLTGLTRPFGHPRLDAYRAPELLSGRELASDNAAVYSVGLMVWELLAGREAFDQSSPNATAESVLTAALSGKLPRLPDDVPALLREIVLEAVNPKPSERFPSMKALSDALTAVQEKRRPGTLIRLMTELGQDLLDRQRGSIVRSNVAPASWRPTVHALQVPPEIPRAPKLIGLAAYQPQDADGPSDSARSVDSLLGKKTQPEPMRVDVPAAAPLSAARPPQATEPLLLVHKDTPAPKPTSSPSVNSALALDADPDFRPSRRWGPLLIVLLVFGGAVAVGVLAFQRHLQQKESDDRPLPAPLGVASNSEEAGMVSSSEDSGTEALPASAATTQRRFQRPARPRGKDAAPQASESAPSASAAPSAAPEPSTTSDNPYAEPPTPAPTTSVDPVLGY